MKTGIAILLSVLVFFQSAGLGLTDIFLFGRFVEHVEYHSQNYCDDFSTFFKKHYGSLIDEHQKNHNEEKQEHQRLPYQHSANIHMAGELILVTFEFPLLKQVVFGNNTSNFHYQNLYSSLENSFIFQPPKLS